MKHYMGIDWGSEYDDVAIINEKGEIVKEFRIKVDKEGFNFLVKILKELKCRKDEIFIGIETDKNIVAEYLIASGYIVYSLNPQNVHKFKMIFSPAKNKNDKLDALSIARMLCMGKDKFKPVCKSSPEIIELIVYVDFENTLTGDKTRLIQRIRSALSLYFPAFSDFFGSFSTSVPVNLLKCISCTDDITNLTYDEYLELIKDVKYMTSKRRKEFYDFIKEKAIDLKSPIIKANILKVSMLVNDLSNKNKQLKEIAKIIDTIYQKHDLGDIFSSLPSSGPKLAPGLLSRFGDNKEKFPSFQSAQCYSGTAPTFEGSGKSLSSVKMRRACNKSFRSVMQKFAFNTLQTEAWAREYYDKQKAKGKNHSAAVRALANKWVKIIWRMWMNNEKYNAEIFLNSRKKYMKNVKGRKKNVA